MFKRVGALVMILAGGLAVFTPAVAQARDRDDYYPRYERHDDRREWRGEREWRGQGWRGQDWREHEWREHERHERWEHRDYRPAYYDYYGRPIYR